MKAFTSTLSDFLHEIGYLNAVPLGSKAQGTRIPTEADGKRLRDRLASLEKASAQLLRLYVTLICVLYAIGTTILVLLHASAGANVAAAVGTIAASVPIIGMLRGVWRERMAIGLAIALIEGLPTAEALDAIRSIYFALKEKR